MKNIFLMFLFSIFCGLIACQAKSQIFPGDGYHNPDSFGVSGHGQALSYKNNGDGTITDNNTKCMWEIKLLENDVGGNCGTGIQSNRSVNCVNNVYNWTSSSGNPDGTLFTDFLVKMNNRCDGSPATEATLCTSNSDCTGTGNGLCGHTGYRDWRIPNVKELQSIVDYGTSNPAMDSIFGATSNHFCWSATTYAGGDSIGAWIADFTLGVMTIGLKDHSFGARAGRTCP
jgi:hypothetical protein